MAKRTQVFPGETIAEQIKAADVAIEFTVDRIRDRRCESERPKSDLKRIDDCAYLAMYLADLELYRIERAELSKLLENERDA